MPAPTTYRSTELTIERDGLTICGQLFVPAIPPAEPMPLLVCAHGFGANYLSCVPYAWEMASQGFAVYCFDFCGGGYAAKSSGNPLQMTCVTERDDIAHVVTTLGRRPDVDETRAYLLGEGLGGLAAILYADDYPASLNGLVLVHPCLNLHDQTRRLFPTKKNIPASYRQQGMRVGQAYGEAAWDINPYEHMQRFGGSVLILHGDEDTTVPIEYSRRAASVFQHARLEVIRPGRHTFKGVAMERATQSICTFLQTA